MTKIKNFQNWINEDFAMVGVAPEGNMGGTMGNPVPPTSTSTGSGDAWPSLGAPSSLAKMPKGKKTKKVVIKKSRKAKQLMKNTLQQESVTNGPTFSIHDVEPGDVVEVEGKEVEITKLTSWVKNAEAACMTFEGTMVETGDPVKVKYDDSHDGYIFC
jgi:hypothetical protein